MQVWDVSDHLVNESVNSIAHICLLSAKERLL